MQGEDFSYKPSLFRRDIKYTIQTIGGVPADEIGKLNDAPFIPVSCDDTESGVFHRLYKTDKPIPESGWVNGYRSDDYASVVWFYLAGRENQLPPLAALDERL